VSDAFYDALATWSQILGSIAFIIVLVWLFVRFVQPAVVASQERKNAEVAETERRRDAARESVAAAQAEVERAAADAQGIRERVDRDAGRLRERIVGEATAEGERVMRNADGELGRARGAARDTLREELLAKALEIARESATRIDPETNARLVGGVIHTIERSEAAG